MARFKVSTYQPDKVVNMVRLLLAPKILITLISVFSSLTAFASDPRELSSIKGFSAGMELEQVKKVLGVVVEFYEEVMPKLTLKLGYYAWNLGECKKRGRFSKVCSERTPSSFTIGGLPVSSIYYYPESKSVRFDLGVYEYSGYLPAITHKSYSDGQALASYLKNQHEFDWKISDIDCGQFGCVEERSLHQGDNRFITVGVGDGGAATVYIKLSRNVGEVDQGDF